MYYNTKYAKIYTRNSSMFSRNKKNSEGGFTLVEAIIGAAIFMILAMSVYQAYTVTMDVVRFSRVKITATALANEQFEIMRNLSYTDVGIVGGLPLGKIPSTQTITRDGKEFTVKTTIRNIDDPFDGTIGGTPNDTSPADYKLAEVEINCATCRNFPPLFVTTNIAPKNLESASTNGALFVKVFDSLGRPISDVDIHIENNQTIPNFSIDDVTNNSGILQIVDAPPSNQAYEIRVSKAGYTSERTYTPGDPENPTPERTDVTVLTQQLTEASFIIDPEGIINVSSISTSCKAVSDIDFNLRGTKIIGTSPIIYKYNATNTTDGSGDFAIEGLDSDEYYLTYPDQTYLLAGLIPGGTVNLSPGTSTDLKIIVAPVASSSLLVSVKDSAGLLLPDVSVKLSTSTYDNTLTTTAKTDCLAQGQVFFTGLNPNNYNLEVSKTGYQTYSTPIIISGDWKRHDVILNP
jgi:type II secretory pathway pseudopilin PulG